MRKKTDSPLVLPQTDKNRGLSGYSVLTDRSALDNYDKENVFAHPLQFSSLQ